MAGVSLVTLPDKPLNQNAGHQVSLPLGEGGWGRAAWPSARRRIRTAAPGTSSFPPTGLPDIHAAPTTTAHGGALAGVAPMLSGTWRSYPTCLRRPTPCAEPESLRSASHPMRLALNRRPMAQLWQGTKVCLAGSRLGLLCDDRWQRAHTTDDSGTGPLLWLLRASCTRSGIPQNAMGGPVRSPGGCGFCCIMCFGGLPGGGNTCWIVAGLSEVLLGNCGHSCWLLLVSCRALFFPHSFHPEFFP